MFSQIICHEIQRFSESQMVTFFLINVVFLSFTGDIKAFITNPTPPQTIQQIGTPPGKGLLIQRQFRGLVPERTFVSYASTTSVAKAKPKKAKAAHTGDGLSISGTSVVPKQTKPGSKRY